MTQATGRKIQQLRRQAALSRQEVARRLGLGYTHYLEIEKGSVPAGAETIRALAELLGVQPSEIAEEAAPAAEAAADVHQGALRRLLVRQKALLELLIEKGVIEESEFQEAYRVAGKSK